MFSQFITTIKYWYYRNKIKRGRSLSIVEKLILVKVLSNVERFATPRMLKTSFTTADFYIFSDCIVSLIKDLRYGGLSLNHHNIGKGIILRDWLIDRDSGVVSLKEVIKFLQFRLERIDELLAELNEEEKKERLYGYTGLLKEIDRVLLVAIMLK